MVDRPGYMRLGRGAPGGSVVGDTDQPAQRLIAVDHLEVASLGFLARHAQIDELVVALFVLAHVMLLLIRRTELRREEDIPREKASTPNIS